MTSIATHKETKEHFKNNNYFGLLKSQIKFFKQGLLPCLSPEGKLLMENEFTISMAPNGNGGLYHALKTSGILDQMKKKGIEYLMQYCVDNILIKIVDPVFVGYLYAQQADCGCKVVPKEYPKEPVGVLCLIDNKYGVVEYSEIGDELAQKKNESTGELFFNAAHICVNAFRRDFLENAADDYYQKMPYHIAKRNVPIIIRKKKLIIIIIIIIMKLNVRIFLLGN